NTKSGRSILLSLPKTSSRVGQKEHKWVDKLFSARSETLGLLPCVAAAPYRTRIIAFLQFGRLIARSAYCTSLSKRNPMTTVRAGRLSRRMLGCGVRLQ